MIKLLPLLFLLQATPTLPAAVERAAYIGGRCSTYFAIGEKDKAMLASSGWLYQLYLQGQSDSRKSPISKAQCQTLISQSGQELEKAMRP